MTAIFTPPDAMISESATANEPVPHVPPRPGERPQPQPVNGGSREGPRLSRLTIAAAGGLLAGLAAPALARRVAPRITSHAGRFTAAQLALNALYRRAVEAAIWGIPAVNYELMFQEMVRKAGGGFNQIVYWSRLLDWKNQTLTPNPDVIYLMPFINTKDVGPMVLEVPPADGGLLNGSVMNYWQAAIEDIGPGGVDKGKGGKYLILPPGYDQKNLPLGFIPMPSDTYQGYALIRSVLKSGSDADIASAVAYGKRLKLYPLSQADGPAPTSYVDASDVVYDASIPYDIRFFESLDRMIQAEPWLERDKAMIDPLKTIGIERGKPFAPDAPARRVLNEAILEAKAVLAESYGKVAPFYDGGHWFFPATEEVFQNIKGSFHTPDSYPIDARGCAYSFAFFSARHLGESQYYLMATHDSHGRPLDGKSSYRLRVPANVPVTQYWSMTVYNRETHTFIRHVDRLGRSSQTPGLQSNADGSVDIFFGPIAPGAESNWIPTDSKGTFEVLARFYGPQKALFDKTWRLPDIERTTPKRVD
jgi:hypothetical protein